MVCLPSHNCLEKLNMSTFIIIKITPADIRHFECDINTR